MLHCPRNTPGYMIRTETGAEHIEIELLKCALMLKANAIRSNRTRKIAINIKTPYKTR